MRDGGFDIGRRVDRGRLNGGYIHERAHGFSPKGTGNDLYELPSEGISDSCRDPMKRSPPGPELDADDAGHAAGQDNRP
jgi:hypothetical protein